ncbi:MAG TPA: hypothetical protein VMR73_01180 [Candidatus Paceibacterota bacterium]|nr:hypothetical protein [Candidatus Paceibacterota bacterium]
MRRLLINLVILVFFFTLPWWCTAVACIAALFLVPPFWEIILWAFFADMFYGIHGYLYGIPFFATIMAIILFLLSLPIQKRIMRRE